MNDPIADFIVRLRNSQRAGHEKMTLPHSKLKAAIAEILHKERIIVGVAEKQVRGKKILEVTLPPTVASEAFPDLTRVSTPGRRIYVKARDIPRPLKGYGLVVLSTPQGVMTGKEARRKGVGGEILFWER